MTETVGNKPSKYTIVCYRAAVSVGADGALIYGTIQFSMGRFRKFWVARLVRVLISIFDPPTAKRWRDIADPGFVPLECFVPWGQETLVAESQP